MHYPPNYGTFQQYALVESDIISKTPDSIDDTEAATIPLGSMTAVVGLFQKTDIAFPTSGPTATGKSVLVLGGSSSVGQYSMSIANSFNAVYSIARDP